MTESDVFGAVADPTRRSILDLLSRGERTVTDLCAHFDVTQPAVSQHLRVLRDASLVTVRAEGRHRFYALEPAAIREVYDWAAHYQKFWHRKLDDLGRVLAAEAAKRGRRR